DRGEGTEVARQRDALRREACRRQALLQDQVAAIGRTVDYEDHLEPVVELAGERLQRRQQRVERLLVAVDGNDQRVARLGHWLPRVRSSSCQGRPGTSDPVDRVFPPGCAPPPDRGTATSRPAGPAGGTARSAGPSGSSCR